MSSRLPCLGHDTARSGAWQGRGPCRFKLEARWVPTILRARTSEAQHVAPTRSGGREAHVAYVSGVLVETALEQGQMLQQVGLRDMRQLADQRNHPFLVPAGHPSEFLCAYL